MKRLDLASELSLPADAVTQTVLVVGKRGSGKSNTAARLVEQLHATGCPFVVLDPVDNWWGLKASRDGKGPGLENIYVFGGAHADLPLEPGGGDLLADVLCEHRTSMVLSVKHFTGGERSRFMTAFALRLLRKWQGGVLHVVLEEAHEFAPQSLPKGEQAEHMLGAFKRLWKLGRASGIGGTAVTQRPASLSKDITTQAEILIAHRTIGPQDVDAIKGWIRYHQESEETLGQLAGLGTGEAFVYSPEFPEGKAIGLRRVTFSLADTFDSRATPKPGERRVEPKALAPVDLEKLRTKMSATIERAKADDPRELRRRIAELERELRAKPAAAPTAQKVKEVPVLKDVHIKRIEKGVEMELRICGMLDARNKATLQALAALKDAIARHLRTPAPAVTPIVARRIAEIRAAPAPAAPRQPAAGNGQSERGGELTGTQRRILDVTHELVRRGLQPNREMIARWLGIHPNGGRYLRDLARLRADGLLEGCLPTAGSDGLARSLQPGLSGVLEGIDGTKQKILDALIAADAPISREQLASALGIHPNGGRFLADLAWLRTMGVITERSPIATTSALFA